MLHIIPYICKNATLVQIMNCMILSGQGWRRWILWVVIVFLMTDSYGQQNNRKLILVIRDQQTRQNIAGATLTSGTRHWVADRTGRAVIVPLPTTSFHLKVTAEGYAPLETHIFPSRFNKVDTIFLLPSSAQLEDVKVNGYSFTRPFNDIATATTLDSKALDQVKGNDLAQILEAVPGVNILQTGNTIGKPVVDGLYGNRVLIINNGVKLEGQAWGVEHAPEIDPSIASSITVIKGADAVRYGAEALGGVVLVDPPPLPYGDPVLHGELSLNGQTNGRGGGTSVSLGSSFKHLPGLAFRLQGSYKRLGNYRAPDYYLENTGTEGKNFSAALGYKTHKLRSEVFFSQYQTGLGIYLGADIGSYADLYVRIHSKGPFDPGSFSYDYSAPYQMIRHQLLKASLHYDLNDGSHIELKYNLQKDFRQEYDKRRSSRATIPITDLLLTTNTLEGSWQKILNSKWHATAGISLRAQSNYNDTITLSNPVIPNYSANSIGVFGIGRWLVNGRLQVEAGLRADYQAFNAAGKRYLYLYYNDQGEVVPNQEVPAYEGHLTLRGRYHNYGGDRAFKNLSFISGAVWKMGDSWKLRSNLGLAWRTPNPEELYSYGLHQSVSSIEYGDSTLKSEKGYKWITAVTKSGSRFSLNANVYLQYIQDYVYLNPTGRFEQTVTGAYPVFRYLQTNAMLKGLDLEGRYRFGREGDLFEYGLKASVVRAYDITKERYLPFIPADRLTNSIQWNLPDIKNLSATFLQFKYKYVSRQHRYEAGSDFLTPPAAYGVFAVLAGTEWLLDAGAKSLSVNVAVENLFNKSYRDYMNRFRYYTDEIGRNVRMRAIFRF